MGIRKPERESTELQRAAMYRPDAGDVLECDSSGGGGYGDPYERPTELVLHDVLDELLSVEKARDSYGVIIDPENLTVDHEQTRALREARRLSSRRS
jgi:N-methylhydantoinase B